MAEQKKKKLPDLPTFAAEIRKLMKEQPDLQPVESWQPEREGEIDIVINREGEWLYQGEPMARQAVVQLLSSIMRKDGDDYFLVTPHEKLKITVEDVPFIVLMMDVEDGPESAAGKGQLIHFSTQVGDCFTLSSEHALSVSYNEREEPAPYVHVRGGMYARLNRSVYYELVDHLVERDASLPEEQLVRSEKQMARSEKQMTRSENQLARSEKQKPAANELGIWSAGKFFIF